MDPWIWDPFKEDYHNRNRACKSYISTVCKIANGRTSELPQNLSVKPYKNSNNERKGGGAIKLIPVFSMYFLLNILNLAHGDQLGRSPSFQRDSSTKQWELCWNKLSGFQTCILYKAWRIWCFQRDCSAKQWELCWNELSHFKMCAPLPETEESDAFKEIVVPSNENCVEANCRALKCVHPFQRLKRLMLSKRL